MSHGVLPTLPVFALPLNFLAPVVSMESLFGALVDPLFQFQPLTWLTHTVIWYTAQGLGGLLDLGAGFLGLNPRAHLFRIFGTSAGGLFYAHREFVSFLEYLAAGNWWGVGDSVLDFVLPALINIYFLVRVLRWTQASSTAKTPAAAT